MLFVTNARLPVGWAGLTGVIGHRLKVTVDFQSTVLKMLSLFNQARRSVRLRKKTCSPAVSAGKSNGYGVFEKSITVEAVGL